MRRSFYLITPELEQTYAGGDAFVSLIGRCEALRKRSSQGERVLQEFHALWNDAHMDITLNLLTSHEALRIGHKIGLLEARMMRNFKDTRHEANE